MPNIDLNIDEYTTSNITLIPFPYGTPIYSYDVSTIPCKEYRLSTDRNSRSKDVKPRRCLKPFLSDWKNQKPKKVGYLSSFDNDIFQNLTRDWRKAKPVRKSKDGTDRYIPPGYTLKNVKTGQYNLLIRDSADSRFVGSKNFSWVPATIPRLVQKTYRRKNPNVSDLKTNDLTYYKQSASVIGGVNTGSSADGFVTNSSLSECFTDASLYPFWESSINKYANPFVPLTYLDDKVDPSGLLTEFSSEVERLSVLALRRHYQKLKNQKVDLATELSQAMLTINMIGDVASRIAKTLLFLKKGDLVSAFRNLFPTSRKEVANDFLMWQYGIKPLLGDIAGAAEHLAEYIQRCAPVKSNGHAKAIVTTIDHPVIGDYSLTISSTTEIRVKYGTSFRVSDALSRQAAQLGFTNPANVVWELVPFSFVVDWFLPIGDFLGNLTSLNGLDPFETYRTVFIKRTITSDESFTPPRYFSADLPPHEFFVNGYQTTTREIVYCKREVIPLPGIPSLSFKSPFSKQHIANAMALLTQLVSKGK